MRLGWRDNLETESPVSISKRSDQAYSQVLLHHCHILAISPRVAELVVGEIEPTPVPGSESILTSLEKVTLNTPTLSLLLFSWKKYVFLKIFRFSYTSWTV